MDNMTDKQMEITLKLVADKFESCKDMDEVRQAVQEVKDMAKKEPKAQN
ncbi:MAG: hypothetical protein FWF44_03015 [Defluviitaleaceae bacterium]|nr:hypothetical protein [Defluviitaleaceae bacterium]